MPRQIWASATTDDGSHVLAPRGGGQRRSRPGACPEEAERQPSPGGNGADPRRRLVEPIGEKWNIEDIGAVRRFSLREEIEQQRRETSAPQGLSDEGVARTEAAAAAAVRKHY